MHCRSFSFPPCWTWSPGQLSPREFSSLCCTRIYLPLYKLSLTSHTPLAPFMFWLLLYSLSRSVDSGKQSMTFSLSLLVPPTARRRRPAGRRIGGGGGSPTWHCRPIAVLLVLLFFVAAAATIVTTLDRNEDENLYSSMLMLLLLRRPRSQAVLPSAANETAPPAGERRGSSCENNRQQSSRPPGSEMLPRGIVRDKSSFEMKPLLGGNATEQEQRPAKSLLAIPVGVKQKATVHKLVSKFPAANFTVMLFHYDGMVEAWGDLPWSARAVHVAAANQTKWWFAKRFLHPDLTTEYNYIFLWDEDIEVDNFDPMRYLDIVRIEGLEISQPALDNRSNIHHRLTARVPEGGTVHRRLTGKGRCSYGNITGPPCAGWVEMMVPVFSRTAWRCVWYMIQNDLIYGWGLDFKLGYCTKGDRRVNVGVVDSEYVLHRGIPALGAGDGDMTTTTTSSPVEGSPSTTGRQAVMEQSYAEMRIFSMRWKEAVAEDECWTNPYH